MIAWTGKVVDGPAITEVKARYLEAKTIGEAGSTGFIIQFHLLATAIIVARPDIEIFAQDKFCPKYHMPH